KLPPCKTKIVATIGPSSSFPEILEKMLLAGMSVARLNFSHGNFEQHAHHIHLLRQASQKTGVRLAILADLPGPKIRLGEIANSPVELVPGNNFTITTDEIIGDNHRASTTFKKLPQVIHPGDKIFINDGLVQLEVISVDRNDVHCKVIVGGPISTRKGINLPQIPLGISAFTDHDQTCLEFALRNGVEIVSQSFVESADDIRAVRAAATKLGASPLIIAKIERILALEKIDEILKEADGIMVARGDLGIEVPIERIAVLQKNLISKARSMAKPIITATQMLESMTSSRIPTRAEATDVANAILDGTDCVMLSAESASGNFPVESVQMLAKIAKEVEFYREHNYTLTPQLSLPTSQETVRTRRALLVEHTLAVEDCQAVLVPTYSGQTARAIARHRLKSWIIALGNQETALQQLCLSYGVFPLFVNSLPNNWNEFTTKLMQQLNIPAKEVLLVFGKTHYSPTANERIELIVL
ncbi:MAG: pyruvate kinase, partial [Chthoniobacterales bacterium]|nr:pyruvate kinase [Chthoniobacterales bacterium]